MFTGKSLYSSNVRRGSGKEVRSWRRYYRKSACILLLVFLSLGLAGIHAQAANKEATPSVQDKEIVYPASQFDDGKARFYEFKTNDGAKIKYFIIKSSDNVIRAAFNTCVVCWREGKGYTQKDDFMVCNNCGKRFKSTKINEVTGGCNPVPLTRKTESGKVVIKIENLLEGKQFFARGGR
jgi:uncharacterized membrane protein